MSTETNNSTASPQYLLLIRGSNDWSKDCSPAELQDSMAQFTQWIDSMMESGILKGANPLEEHEGSVVSGANGQTVTDGPFAESKELVGGYFLIQVDSLEKATAIAKQNPLLKFGYKIEVRRVAPTCPVMTHANMDSALTERLVAINQE